MNTFLNIGRKPDAEGFVREPAGGAVVIGETASGYPVLNKLFTFEPDIIEFELRGVIDPDMQTVMDFYEDNKDVPFYWYDDQGKKTYEVCFAGKPGCRLDGCVDLWRITIKFKQTNPETT